jgi:predicted dehydrogenase
VCKKILIVGVGSIGERHLRCFQTTGRCELAICEPNDELRATIADRYGISHSFSEVEAAIAGGTYDGAVIATPAPHHVRLATLLANQQCHLLIEKPLSTNFDGIDVLRQAVARQSLVAAVGYCQRAHPGLQALKAQLDSGRFGRPLQVRFVLGHPFAHFRPAYRDVYFARREDGGGAIQDAMTHMYNSVQWLVGPCTRLVTDATHRALDGVEVEDTVHTLARHGNVMAAYTLNMYEASNELMLTVTCEAGTVQCDFKRVRWSWVSEPAGPWNHQPVELPERDTLYTAQATGFLDSIDGKARPLCTLEEGIDTLRTNLASLKSSDLGEWQQIDR